MVVAAAAADPLKYRGKMLTYRDNLFQIHILEYDVNEKITQLK